MSAHRETHLELCAGYVLGALDDADRRELESHRASGCDVCEREIVRLEQATQLLASSVTPVAPPASLRARTLAAVAASGREAGGERASVTRLEQPERVRPGFALPRWALAAAALIMVAATGWLWTEGNRLREELSTAKQLLATREQELEDQRRWNAVLDAIDAQSVSLIRTPDGAPELRGRGVWDPATRRAVIVFEHLSPPEGRDYQLWGLHPDGPRSLGVIKSDSAGRAIVRLEDAGDAATLEAFAVSLEPAGGSPNPKAPTGPVVMVGRVGG